MPVEVTEPSSVHNEQAPIRVKCTYRLMQKGMMFYPGEEFECVKKHKDSNGEQLYWVGDKALVTQDYLDAYFTVVEWASEL